MGLTGVGEAVGDLVGEGVGTWDEPYCQEKSTPALSYTGPQRDSQG